VSLEYRPDEFKVAASGDLAFERGKVWSARKSNLRCRRQGASTASGSSGRPASQTDDDREIAARHALTI